MVTDMEVDMVTEMVAPPHSGNLKFFARNSVICQKKPLLLGLFLTKKKLTHMGGGVPPSPHIVRIFPKN